MLRAFIHGFIKIHILYHASEDPVYGLAMIEELGRHGYAMSPGTLYPILHDMENQGLLKKKNVIVGGRVRKYYIATSLGKAALRELRPKVRALVEEICEAEPQ